MLDRAPVRVRRTPGSIATPIFIGAVVAFLGIVLPVAGAWLAERPLALYAAFPVIEARAEASFQWMAFVVYALLIGAVLAPLAWRLATAARAHVPISPTRRFPWWGWVGVAFTLGAWCLAWTRFGWFASLQPYTFTPLWLGYIVVVNALVFGRRGRCPLLDNPICFAVLFPTSAVFWWYFEYLNRFVGNWHYVATDSFGAIEYFAHASLSFSTVLPAVVSTRAWLASYPRLPAALNGIRPVRGADSRAVAWILLLFAAVGYVALGTWPQYSYSMVWVAPALALISLQVLAGYPSALADLRRGDWRRTGLAALAALLCGFFWEMWNAYSLAHWEYDIPLVHRFLLFEMPLLGYAGYLPFGIVCVAAAELVCGTNHDAGGA